ncbi:DNA polymerase [Zeaxanthinibacter sp. PT1]|uniref:DNA polymerase n=1 Tax=Zeaxanthinibacter TaxID=561554 RepID=UPI002349B4AA|nr:DNA polymerase [Zeaxanthinibacter sp. PT1]MDC6350733.1 DNA polymerase [Zeaxanthinibacter sp. PT1]
MIYVLTPERNAIPSNEYQYIDSIEFIHSYLFEHQPSRIAVDTETTGLDFIDDKMVMFQIGDLDNQFIVDTRYHKIDSFRMYLEDTDITKVLQNAKFDYKFIKQASGIELDKVFDTMLADKVINGGKEMPSGMDELAPRYLNEWISKSAQKSFLKHRGPFTEEQIIYGAKDLIIPLRLCEVMIPMLKEKDLTYTASLEFAACLAFADIEFNGIEVDKELWLKRADQTLEDLKTCETEMNTIIETDPFFKEFQDPDKQLDLWIPDDQISYVNIDWNSRKPVLEIFNKIYHGELTSLSKDVLGTLEHRPPLIRAFMKYKKLKKLYDSYGPSMLDKLKSDGKIHTHFSQVLTTGRVSNSKPNMQQIPADNSFRNCFVCSDPDWVFVSSDYSSQELCVIATLAKDPVWIAALEQGKDLHSVCAALVFGKKWENAAEPDCAFYKLGEDGGYENKKCECPGHKTLRSGVKSINFGLAYGMSEYALSDTLGISVPEARELIETYFKTFPSIRATLQKFGDYGKRHGYIMTMPPFKRKRYFPKHKYIGEDSSISGQIERASKNTPIQGSSADMVKLALVKIRKYIKRDQVPVKLVMTVHDQVDTIAHVDYADTWRDKLTELMEDAAKTIITNGLLKAETEVSRAWKK